MYLNPSNQRSNMRPIKNIDWEKVDRLLMAGCYGTEIAPHFDMHHETFYDRVRAEKGIGFTEYCALKKCQGDSLLKEKQFEKAISGDNTLLIWLGKARLNQRDTPVDDNVNPEILAKYHVIMDQIKKAQDARKIEDNSNIKEQKSE